MYACTDYGVKDLLYNKLNGILKEQNIDLDNPPTV
jgi:hypothetical protein